MYKVLIADDEQPVLDGLQFLIKKHFENLTVAATARTGREAIEQAKLVHPDIILMDVKMPGITGLDAVREIRLHLPRAICILVTAYERFDIAREAFELGVHDYLLKPVSKDKLITVISNAAQVLEDRRGSAKREVEAKEALDAARPLLEQAFIAQAPYPHPVTQDWEALLASLNLRQPMATAVIVQLKPEEKHEEIHAFYLNLREALRYKTSIIVGALKENELTLIFPHEQAVETPWSQLASLAPQSPLQWRAGIGTSNDWNNIWRSISCAQRALSQTAWGQLKPSEITPNAARAYPFAQEKALVRAVLHGDRDQTKTLTRQVVQQLEILSEDQADFFRSKLWELLAVITHEAGMNGGPSFIAPMRELSHLESIADLNVFVEESILALCSVGLEQTTYSPVLEKAMDYLAAHFETPLSLDDVAAAVGVHPQYLSRLFSEEKKESFVDYLTRLRIQKAKILLCNGAAVKDVSQALGFSDPNYFSRLFKKWEGATPMEFASKRRASL